MEPTGKSALPERRLGILELLCKLRLVRDEAHGRALIMAGKVLVNEQRVDKPGIKVFESDNIRIKSKRFVGRGGDKLWGAVEDLGIQEVFEGKTVLDVGASTGGFVDCCLQLGAKKVIALDVGKNLLHWSLRKDERVICLEGTHIRDFKRSDSPAIDIVVADLSFIGLSQVVPLLRNAAPQVGARFLVLVKPQFELEREKVPRGGVVLDTTSRKDAVEKVMAAFRDSGLDGGEIVDSRIRGRSGNREIFFYVVSK